jgi:uncharacterized OB-fold protein
MTAWRESSDPRCPECGGKITASASYCMHCEAEFDDEAGGSDEGTEYAMDDIDADVSSSDDVSYGDDADDGSGIDPQQQADDGSLFGIGDDDAEVGADPSDHPEDGIDATAQPDVGDAANEDGPASEADVEETTLLLRGPVSLIMSFPAGLLFMLGTYAGFGGFPGVAYAGVFFLAWAGVTAYLLTKPLASDAIGDAFYVYAVVMLLIPPVWILGTLVEVVLGADVAVGDRMLTAIIGEFMLLFPAGFLLLLGYGANYYARQKIEAALGEQTGA